MVLSFRLFSVLRVAIELAVSVLFLLCAADAYAQASRVGLRVLRGWQQEDCVENTREFERSFKDHVDCPN